MTLPRRLQMSDNLLGNGYVRSILAAPLLDAMREDIAVEDLLNQRFGKRLRGRKAIFFSDLYRGGLPAAVDAVRAKLGLLHEAGRIRRRPSVRPDEGGDIALVSMSYRELELLREAWDVDGPIKQTWPRLWDVIIDVNLKFKAPLTSAGRNGALHPDDPRLAAKDQIAAVLAEAMAFSAQISGGRRDSTARNSVQKNVTSQYVFARLDFRMLAATAKIDAVKAQSRCNAEVRADPQAERGGANDGQGNIDCYRAIHQIWPDFEVNTFVYRSMRTVKADAAQNSFGAFGDGVTWAVVDTGVDADHPHFQLHDNIVRDPRMSFDFTADADEDGMGALRDKNGHGTHVAAIIAGQQLRAAGVIAAAQPGDGDIARAGQADHDGANRYPYADRLKAASLKFGGFNSDGEVIKERNNEELATIAGIAPKCKIVSLRVLNNKGRGRASVTLKALEHVQTLNNYGRDLKIHGVNLSLGHGFEAEWFACGHSPLCVEVNRLVKSGVVVVVSAGNSGYGVINASDNPLLRGALDMSINDPGNAELAITVGSTHRDEPHRYGVSYFSSKGPTGDGRSKPDLLAPGERIVSAAAAGSERSASAVGNGQESFAYMEMSGTSQAAPHVSGAIAAFLSIRSEFIGEPERVKKIFVATATDVGRDRSFQGAGVVDLLRAIQSV